MLVLGNDRVLFFAVSLPFVVGEFRVVLTIFILMRDCGCVEIALGVHNG
jgi:hypothetical protein